MSGFSGQGKVNVGFRQANGQPGLLRWIGNASKFVLSLTEDDSQRSESFSGNRLPYRQMTKTRRGELSIIFDEFSKENLALMSIANVSEVPAGNAVQDYAFPIGAKVGNILAAPAKNLSLVSVQDSGAATLAVGVNYLLNAFAGNVELINLTTGGPFVQPFKMDFTPGAVTKIGAFNRAVQDVYIQFEGINTDDGTPIVADIYRSRLKPAKEFAFINDDYADFELTGSVLADLTRTASSAEGQFYSITLPTA